MNWRFKTDLESNDINLEIEKILHENMFEEDLHCNCKVNLFIIEPITVEYALENNQTKSNSLTLQYTTNPVAIYNVEFPTALFNCRNMI